MFLGIGVFVFGLPIITHPVFGKILWEYQQVTTPSVTFASSSSTVNEDVGTHNVTINISPTTSGALTIFYNVAATGTATEIDDYRIVSLSPVSSDPNASSVGITINITDDDFDEENQTVILQLAAETGYNLGSITTHTLIITDNDPTVSPYVGFARGDDILIEGHSRILDVRIDLSEFAPESGLTLNYTISGEATRGTDYTITGAGTISVGGNADFANIPVTAIDDAQSEYDERIILTLTNGSGYNVINSDDIEGVQNFPSTTIAIFDDDGGPPLPELSFASATGSVSEGDGPHTVTLNLSNPAVRGGARYGFFSGGTADEGDDYTIDYSSEISEWETSGNVVITIIDDNVDEPNETIILSLTAGSDGRGYADGDITTYTLTIGDNSGVALPEVSFASTSGSAAENAGTRNVAVNIRPAAPSGGLTLNYGLGGTATRNTDYTSSGTVLVTAGATSVNIPVVITDDNNDEGNETIVLTLQSGSGYNVGSANTHTLTITDNDGTTLPEVTFASASGSVSESAGTRNVAVNLSPAAPSGGLTLNYGLGGTATRNTDYTSSGTVSVTAGATSVNIPVVITDDNADEGNETIILTLTGGTGYTVGGANVHTLTITDNDGTVVAAPEITFASASNSVDEDAGTHNVAVNLSPAAPSGGLTLNYGFGGTAARNTDYTSSGTVSVTAGATSVNIPVVITDDSADEEDETIILTLQSGTGYTVGSADTHTLTITDNDTPATPEIAFASASASVNEDAGTHNILVNIVPAPQADLALSYNLGGTAVEGEDYSISGSGTVAVTAGETSVNIPVVIIDDSEEEESKTIILTLQSGAGYDVGSADTHTLTITDNDTPEIVFASASGSVDEDAGTHNVIVNIVPAPQADLALSYDLGGTAAEGEDYSISSSGTVAVTAGETSVNIPVMVTDDNEDEEDETIVLTLTSGAGYEVGDVNIYTLTITDNDMTPEAAFYSASTSVAEDAGAHNVAVRIHPAPESDLTLTYGLEGTAKEDADYSIANSGTLSVVAGVDSVNIAILIADDSEDESDETVILTLTDGVGYSVGSMKVYTLTITDNDATVNLSASPNPVSEGEDVTVMATLSEAAPSEISIPLVLTAGTAEEGDYGALSAIVIDKDERSGTGMINTFLDSDLDDETFTITFGTLPAGIVAGTQASVEVTITDAGERTSIESLGEEIPSEFSLAQNYPNPFNPSTAIEFSLTRTGQVTLTVYDMLGQKVRTLLEGVQPAGSHSVLFNGVGLASDTYIYVLQTEQHRAVKMMTLLK